MSPGASVALEGPDARRLVFGDLDALFLPSRGMLCASLRRNGSEFLRRIDDLDMAARHGSTVGISLLYPWANRLDGTGYSIAGRDVTLDPASPLLHFDANGLPIHGVPWSRLEWQAIEANPVRLHARLIWKSAALLGIFPFPHCVDMVASLDAEGLCVETRVCADAGSAVPVSFGFHPYFGIPGLPRSEWRLRLPPMRSIALDSRGIPTGNRQSSSGSDSTLGERSLDDAFHLEGERASFAVEGAGRSVTVEFLHGFHYAQVYAPPNDHCIALEPMTAPTAALSSGRGLTLIEPGSEYRAAFRIRLV